MAISPVIQHTRQRLAGKRLLHPRHFFGRALGHDSAPLIAALRPQVDDPIRLFHHVQIVLDDNNGVAEVRQAVEHREELFHVVEVEPGGRLVQYIQRPPRLAAAQFAPQLDALGLTPGKGGGRLAQVDVAQSDVEQRLET